MFLSLFSIFHLIPSSHSRPFARLTNSSYLGQSTVEIYDFFTRLWLDDRLTRKFTYLYMCLRGSIFIKMLRNSIRKPFIAISSFFFSSELNFVLSPELRLTILIFLSNSKEFCPLRSGSSFENHILLSLLSWILSIKWGESMCPLTLSAFLFPSLSRSFRFHSSCFFLILSPKHTWMNKNFSWKLREMENGSCYWYCFVFVVHFQRFSDLFRPRTSCPTTPPFLFPEQFCSEIILYECTSNINYSPYLPPFSCHFSTLLTTLSPSSSNNKKNFAV